MSKVRYIFYLLTFLVATGLASYFAVPATNLSPGAEKLTEAFEDVLRNSKSVFPGRVNPRGLLSGAVNRMLSDLDPHSCLLTPEMYEKSMAGYRGNYTGVGVTFDVIGGYITVITILENSPAARAGLAPGDKIVEIDGEKIIGITRTAIPEKIHGEAGSKITLGIRRLGQGKIIYRTLIRERLPIKSVVYPLMLDERTGYLKILRFARQTPREMEQAIQYLTHKGMMQLIIDLRSNPGGYLESAIQATGRFLEPNTLITYVKRRSTPRSGSFLTGKSASGPATFTNDEYFTRKNESKHVMPLIVLIDQGTASAGEIFAGAIQDNDRGLVIGSISFGKGLVQQPFLLSDNSALLLTIGKYHTPSGRIIQKRYKGIDPHLYLKPDLPYAGTESQKPSKPFFTKLGRRVYSHGGITPDIVLSRGSAGDALAFKVYYQRHLFAYASIYVSQCRLVENDFGFFLKNFEISDEEIRKVHDYLVKDKMEFKEADFDSAKDTIALLLKSEIAGLLWGPAEATQIRSKSDGFILKAMESFPKAKQLFDTYRLAFRLTTKE